MGLLLLKTQQPAKFAFKIDRKSKMAAVTNLKITNIGQSINSFIKHTFFFEVLASFKSKCTQAYK